MSHLGSKNTTLFSKQTFGHSARAYALITLAGLTIGIGLLLFYVYQVPKMVENGVQSQVFYLLMIPWALSCAAFLFGAMRSVAHFTHKDHGSFLELGGPIVLFCLVLAGGFKLVPSAGETFDLTVRAKDQDVAVITSGKITAEFGNTRRKEDIGLNGEVNFKGIPSKFRGALVGFLPQISGYEQKWQQLRVLDDAVDLPLQREQGDLNSQGRANPPPKDLQKFQAESKGTQRAPFSKLSSSSTDHELVEELNGLVSRARILRANIELTKQTLGPGESLKAEIETAYQSLVNLQPRAEALQLRPDRNSLLLLVPQLKSAIDLLAKHYH